MTDLLCTVCNPALIAQGYPEAWCHPCILAESVSDTTTSVMSVDEVVRAVLPLKWHHNPHDLPERFAPVDLTRQALFVAGPSGHGKTTIMTRLMERQIRHAFRVGDTPRAWQFWDHAVLLSKLRSGARNGEAERILQECVEARVLIIDDLGRVNPTPYARECLWRIVNDRYSRGLVTSVTTNVTLDDLRDDENIGPALTDRMVEDATMVEWADVNHRLKRRVSDSAVQTTMTGAEA